MSKKSQARVEITYEDPTGGQPKQVRLKNRALILAALTGHAPADLGADPIRIDKTNLNRLAGLRPVLDLEVANRLTTDAGALLALHLEFDRGPDNWPAAVVAQTPALAKLARLREALLTLKAKLRTNPALKREVQQLLPLLGRDRAAQAHE